MIQINIILWGIILLSRKKTQFKISKENGEKSIQTKLNQTKQNPTQIQPIKPQQKHPTTTI